VKFSPHSQQQVGIGELLEGKGSSATAGSILVMQSSALAGPSIAGALAMTYLGSPDPNYIDEEPSMLNMMGSQMLQGVADRANGSPIVAISSMAEAAQHVKVECLGDHGTIASKQIELAPGETLLADACAGPDAPAIDAGNDLFERMADTEHGPLGIRLTSDAMPGSFAAFAVAPHLKNGDRFLSSVLFADPMLVNSPNTVFTGIPVGSATLLPDGNYTPEISVVNFSTSEIHVHTTFAQTTGSSPNSREVSGLTVPPGSSRELVLDGLKGDPGLQNSFIVHSDGAPGALMAKLVSKSDSQLHEVESQAKDESDMNNSGNHPWSIEQNTESTLLLFNHSATQQPFDLTITGAGVSWQKTYELASMQTKAISIGELVADQIKDENGNVLPKTAQSGELNWMIVDPNNGSGRLLQSDRSTGMARNFSCGYSGLLCGSNVDVFETLLPDGSIDEFANITPITCTSGTQNACSGQQTGSGGSFSYSWISGTPSVASVSGYSTTANVNLLGVAPGTSQVTGRASSEYCQSSGGGQQAVGPSISSIDPAQGLVGTAINNVMITGTGFTVVASVNAGSNVSVSNVHFVSSTQLTATFTPSNAPSAGGNQGVTVTVSSHPSNSANFYVQVPTHIAYINTSQTPNSGQSTTVSGTSINIVSLSAGTIATNACGGYMWLTYQLMDQEATPQRIQNGTVIWSESFSNLSPSTPPWTGAASPGAPFSIDLSDTVLADTYYIYGTTGCPAINSTLTFHQAWTPNVGGAISGGVVSGGVTYPLTTVISGSESTNSGGIPSFGASISTP
jgi:hypothetical protein